VSSITIFITRNVRNFLIKEREQSRGMVNNQAAYVGLATVLGAGGRSAEELSIYLSEYPDLVYCVTISLFSTHFKDGICFVKNEELAREYEHLFREKPEKTKPITIGNMLNIISPVKHLNNEGDEEIAGYILSGFSLDSIEAENKKIVVIILRIGAIVLLLSMALAYFMTSLFIKPIGDAITIIDNVAEGDFRNNLYTKSKSEIGRLVATINKMIFKWRSSIEKMKEVIDMTGTSSVKMSDAAKQQENITSEQASAVNEITTTVDELNTSSKQVYEKAEKVSKSSNDVLAIASDGQRAVKRSIEEIRSIRVKIKTVSEQTLNLSVEAQQIGSIVKAVSEIANKTDMLAINAGIEAARAGEYGKGFSIVATEVRDLADQSQKSAEKISSLIENIQSSTNSTVLSTEQAIDGFQIGLKLILEAGKTIDNLIKHIQETVNYASEIALASRQQSLGNDQVTSVIANINDGMKVTAESASQILSEANNLKKLSSNLSDVANIYKV